MRMWASVCGVALFAGMGALGFQAWKQWQEVERLREEFSTVAHLQHVRFAAKEIGIQSSLDRRQLWVEYFEGGEKRAGEKPPLHDASGPFVPGARTSVHAAAWENPEYSGKLTLVIRFPELGSASWMSIELPESWRNSSQTWSLGFLSGDIRLKGSEPVDLLAISRTNQVGGEVERWAYAGDAGQLPTFVIRMGLAAHEWPEAK